MIPRSRSVTPNIRRRSARRRSSEKSARQIRREFDDVNHLERELSKLCVRARMRLDGPPAWMVKGVLATYREAPDNPASIYCTVLDKPFRVTAKQWGVLIDKKRGWVPIESLSPVS